MCHCVLCIVKYEYFDARFPEWVTKLLGGLLYLTHPPHVSRQTSLRSRGSSRHVSRSVSLYCLPRPSPEMSCSRKNAILVDGPRPGVPGRSGLVRSEDGAHRRGGALGPARPAQQPKRGLSSGHTDAIARGVGPCRDRESPSQRVLDREQIKERGALPSLHDEDACIACALVIRM